MICFLFRFIILFGFLNKFEKTREIRSETQIMIGYIFIAYLILLMLKYN